ncbi:hypothetical protein VWH97_06375 [Escherichia coli O157]|nr:hypothetical protein [Escherichia coli O157]
MSLQSALKEAKKIHEYMIKVKGGEIPGIFKMSETEYCTKNIEDFDGSDTLVLQCDDYDHDNCGYNPLYYFINYYPGSDITVYNPDYYGKDLTIPFSVLDGPWDSEEYYFQQSTVYTEHELDTLVIMWYFKSIDSTCFYMDYEYIETQKYKR